MKIKPETWLKIKEIALSTLTLILTAFIGAMIFYFVLVQPQLIDIRMSLDNYFEKCLSNCVVQFNQVPNFMEKCKMVCEVG